MKRMMMGSMFFSMMLSFAQVAYSGECTTAIAAALGGGPTECFVECTSASGSEFVIRPTAVLTYQQGILLYPGATPAQASLFDCKAVQESELPGVPAANATEWKCEEIRDVGTKEGILKFGVAKNPRSRDLNGVLTQDQIFPLKPYLVEKFTCRIP